jgi:hypothetical protein
MMDKSKIIVLPSVKGRAPRQRGSEEMASEVRRVWRKLHRAIKAAEKAGLTVQVTIDSIEPRIIKQL